MASAVDGVDEGRRVASVVGEGRVVVRIDCAVGLGKNVDMSASSMPEVAGRTMLVQAPIPPYCTTRLLVGTSNALLDTTSAFVWLKISLPHSLSTHPNFWLGSAEFENLMENLFPRNSRPLVAMVSCPASTKKPN